MHIKKIGINVLVLIGVILFNTNTIQAEENKTINQQQKKLEIQNNQKKKIEFKKVNLNESYKHEIRYEPFDKEYDKKLYIEFDIPKDGYVTFKRSNPINESLNESSKNYEFNFNIVSLEDDNNIGRDVYFNQKIIDKEYTIAMPKGKVKIELEPEFIIKEDYYIDYTVQFEEKNTKDFEVNESRMQACNINLNTEYEGILESYDGHIGNDGYIFYNNVKNDLKIKFKSDDIDADSTEKEKCLEIDIYNMDSSSMGSLASAKLKDMEFDGEYYILELNRFPRGEYILYISGEGGHNPEFKIKDYKFIIEAPKVFTDIEGHWANKTITDFIKKGYINGYEDNTFRPDNNITRAEFVKVLNTALGLTEKKGITFSDTTNHWAREAIDIAVTNGICKGVSDTEFKPDDYITREQVSVMIANYKKIKDTDHDKLNQYTDSNIVSSWAIDSVEGMIENKYMNGYSEDNTFRPINNITRAEAVSTLSRVIK